MHNACRREYYLNIAEIMTFGQGECLERIPADNEAKVKKQFPVQTLSQAKM